MVNSVVSMLYCTAIVNNLNINDKVNNKINYRFTFLKSSIS